MLKNPYEFERDESLLKPRWQRWMPSRTEIDHGLYHDICKDKEAEIECDLRWDKFKGVYHQFNQDKINGPQVIKLKEKKKAWDSSESEKSSVLDPY